MGMRLERNSRTGNAIARVAATWLSLKSTLGRRRVIVAWSSRAQRVREETHICELRPTSPASNEHTSECCSRENEQSDIITDTEWEGSGQCPAKYSLQDSV